MAAPAQRLFSIVTPVYNSGGARLEATIQSVLAQDPRLFEYLIVDGGSTDDTTATLARYDNDNDDRVRVLRGPDRGVYDAMNKGIAASRGRYVYFIGAGDRLCKDVLSKVQDSLPAGELNFVYGDTNMLDRSEPRYDGPFDAAKLRQRNICHQAIFYQRTLFDRVGTFNLKYPILADYELNLRCFGDARVRKVHIDHVIADFEGSGISSRRYDEAFLYDKAGLVWRHLGTRQLLLRHVDLARGALAVGRREAGNLRRQPRAALAELRGRLGQLLLEVLQR